MCNISSRFMRAEHVYYLLCGLKQLPSWVKALDASRPWLVYWIIHSLSLMSMIENLPNTTVDKCAFIFSPVS